MSLQKIIDDYLLKESEEKSKAVGCGLYKWYGGDKMSIEIGTSLETIEKHVIQKTLKFTNGNKKRTAELLGISRKSLYNKISQFEIIV